MRNALNVLGLAAVVAVGFLFPTLAWAQIQPVCEDSKGNRYFCKAENICPMCATPPGEEARKRADEAKAVAEAALTAADEAAATQERHEAEEAERRKRPAGWREPVRELRERVGELEARPANTGPQGEVGPQGPTGPQGLRGEKGDSIVGPQGPAGRDGKDGRSFSEALRDSVNIGGGATLSRCFGGVFAVGQLHFNWHGDFGLRAGTEFGYAFVPPARKGWGNNVYSGVWGGLEWRKTVTLGLELRYAHQWTYFTVREAGFRVAVTTLPIPRLGGVSLQPSFSILQSALTGYGPPVLGWRFVFGITGLWGMSPRAEARVVARPPEPPPAPPPALPPARTEPPMASPPSPPPAPATPAVPELAPLEPTSAPAPKPPDFDGDGVPDTEDRCKDNPGKKKYQGCPDAAVLALVVAMEGAPPPPPPTAKFEVEDPVKVSASDGTPSIRIKVRVKKDVPVRSVWVYYRLPVDGGLKTAVAEEPMVGTNIWYAIVPATVRMSYFVKVVVGLTAGSTGLEEIYIGPDASQEAEANPFVWNPETGALE